MIGCILLIQLETRLANVLFAFVLLMPIEILMVDVLVISQDCVWILWMSVHVSRVVVCGV